MWRERLKHAHHLEHLKVTQCEKLYLHLQPNVTLLKRWRRERERLTVCVC